MDKNYKAIHEASIDSFCITDVFGRFLSVNKAFLIMSGYTKTELLTKTLQDLESKKDGGVIN
jgi:PAS domain S-box-containing protein